MSKRRVRAERCGRFAETLCVARLRLTGWSILARCLKSPRGSGLGEIDIVARRGSTVAFIEVKARLDESAAVDALTTLQRGRIARAADAFLQRHPELSGANVRFDVMVVGQRLVPRLIADAWRPQLP
ncbi:MAG: YraN family protein [Rhodospirillaceae bacterium]|nr:YraN family protein [Rhodospirillaceae bacterium]